MTITHTVLEYWGVGHSQPPVAALTRATYRDLCLATVRGMLAVLGGEEPSSGARRVRS